MKRINRESLTLGFVYQILSCILIGKASNEKVPKVYLSRSMYNDFYNQPEFEIPGSGFIKFNFKYQLSRIEKDKHDEHF